MSFRFRDGFWDKVAWGKPDSPQRNLCAVCHGPLPDVPLRCWDEDGSSFALCDPCVEEWLEVS